MTSKLRTRTVLAAAAVAALLGGAACSDFFTVPNTMKALAFLYVIEARDSLGAPVDVDISIPAPPAPFVAKDSVYGYALGLLDSARADLTRDGTAAFPFAVPPGLNGTGLNAADFSSPALFITSNRAPAAKARVLRATAAYCGAPA